MRDWFLRLRATGILEFVLEGTAEAGPFQNSLTRRFRPYGCPFKSYRRALATFLTPVFRTGSLASSAASSAARRSSALVTT